jgi:hypothetical protein
MEINQRQQDKFSAGKSTLWVERVDGSRREIDYIEIEKAIKDFCFIRHELSTYSYLYASQMQFDIHLNLTYWEYLFLNGHIDKADKDELEEGSLLTIYLFFKEIYEAGGYCFLYRHNLFATIAKTLNLYQPDNNKKTKMLEIIKFAQENYSNDKLSGQCIDKLNDQTEKLRNILIENDNWVYFEFIEKYYIDKANSFEPLRQKTKNFYESIKNGGQK